MHADFQRTAAGPRKAIDCDPSRAFFAPLHYEPKYRYPLVVWLHGPGEDERQLGRVMPWISMRNYVGVAPRATVACGKSPGHGGYRWGDAEAEILSAAERVSSCIAAAAERFHIALDRIFVAGQADGGSMALRVSLSDPGRFAGAISLGGRFPTGHCPLWRYSEARCLPLLLVRGRDSMSYPPERLRHDVRLLHIAGMQLTFREYMCGDELHREILNDMNRWLMQQICPQVP